MAGALHVESDNHYQNSYLIINKTISNTVLFPGLVEAVG